MAISNYTELQAAIADFLARNDLTSHIPNFIVLAESRLNRELRTRDMETSGTVTMTSGSGTLPADYLEWISARWEGASRQADLEYVEPNSERWIRRFRPNGDPTMFTTLATTIKLRPVISGNITLFYYKAVPPLATNSTNWLLTRSPDLYLNLSLAEAYKFTKDDPKAAGFLNLAIQDSMKLVQDADSNKVGRRGLRASEVEQAAAARNPATGVD